VNRQTDLRVILEDAEAREGLAKTLSRAFLERFYPAELALFDDLWSCHEQHEDRSPPDGLGFGGEVIADGLVTPVVAGVVSFVLGEVIAGLRRRKGQDVSLRLSKERLQMRLSRRYHNNALTDQIIDFTVEFVVEQESRRIPH
jgi:hypothetical protein